MGAGGEVWEEANGRDGFGEVGDGENPCSICLDAVASAGSGSGGCGGGGRSTVRLQCGHEFHLDCIGSAFNFKGLMQCPNCRGIENGRWLCANVSGTSQDFYLDEWNLYEDTYDDSDSEMANDEREQHAALQREELARQIERMERDQQHEAWEREELSRQIWELRERMDAVCKRVEEVERRMNIALAYMQNCIWQRLLNHPGAVQPPYAAGAGMAEAQQFFCAAPRTLYTPPGPYTMGSFQPRFFAAGAPPPAPYQAGLSQPRFFPTGASQPGLFYPSQPHQQFGVMSALFGGSPWPYQQSSPAGSPQGTLAPPGAVQHGSSNTPANVNQPGSDDFAA